MIVLTHRKIAQNIYNQIERLCEPGKINRKAFIYGNMKPDITLHLFKLSHRMEDSLNFVMEMIDRLLTEQYHSVTQFSIDLGVVAHFMADFFCSAHYYKDTGFDKNIVRHLRYEFKFHRYFKKQRDNFSLYITRHEVNDLSGKELREVIQEEGRRYGEQITSIDNDLKYIMKMSSLISVYIVNQSLCLNEKTELKPKLELTVRRNG